MEYSRKNIYVKNVPDDLVPIFSLVCAKFPELQHEHIVLRYKKIKTTMQASPYVIPFFKKRWYVFFINNHPNFEGVGFNEIPFEAKVGLIAHEFCHVMDYQRKSIWGLMKTGIGYLFNKSKAAYEKEIDSMAVEKGFGPQLKSWSYYVLHQSDASHAYKKFKEETYLSPEEIDWLHKSQEKKNQLL